MRDVDFDSDCDGKQDIKEGICNIKEGIKNIRDGLNDICKCGICKGIDNIRDGLHDIEKGLCDIIKGLKIIWTNPKERESTNLTTGRMPCEKKYLRSGCRQRTCEDKDE